jgi:hypothetical protein
MQHKVEFFAVILLCISVSFAGCTGTPQIPPVPQIPAAGTPAPSTPAQNNLVTSPTDVIPDNYYISIIVQEKVYDAKIPVVFDGGKGLYMAKSASVTLYRSDGQVITKPLGIKKGDFVEMEGTKQTDRVVAYVSMMNGETYKVADVLSEYRTR